MTDTFFHLELTDKCNLRCVWCSAGNSNKKSETDFDECVRILEKAKDISLDGIFFNDVQLNGWGEPCLYKRLGEIIAVAKKHFPKVHFITNGTLLTEQKIDEVLRAGLDYVCISMTGVIPEVYSKFQGSGIPYERCEHQLNKVIASIKLLCEKKKSLNRPFRVVIRFIISDDSREHLSEFVKYWRHTGVDEIYVTPLFDFNRDRKKGEFKVLRCNMVPRRYHIAANGEVFPCNCNYNPSRNYMGNIKEQPYEEIVQSDLFLSERKARESCDLNIVPKSCITCEYRCYKDTISELMNERRRIFLNSPIKNTLFRLFGPAVVFFERITRVQIFYDLWLSYVRRKSKQIHDNFQKEIH